MGNILFGVDISGIIADAMGDALPGVTITREIVGERQPGNLTGGRAKTYKTFDCTGFWDDIDPRAVPPGITIEVTDRKLVLIGDTVPVDGFPLRNDECTVHEDGGDITLYCVQQLARDPAAAVFTYLCRDRKGPDGK